MSVFRIRRGAEVIIAPSPGADESVLRLLLLGPVLGVLLHQRDRLILHASAVAMTGAAVGFLGGSGSGKSTTAAALHARGFGLVTDDVLALDPGGPDGPVAYPGVPQLKLWPDAATAVGDDPDALPRLRPGDDKRARHALAGFRPEPLPLWRLYVLTDAERAGIDALSPRDAVIELVRYSYTPGLLQVLGPARHFRQCARLAAQVPVRRLRRPHSLAALAHLAAMVDEDIASCPHPARLRQPGRHPRRNARSSASRWSMSR
jgi:hypothetical protein